MSAAQKKKNAAIKVQKDRIDSSYLATKIYVDLWLQDEISDEAAMTLLFERMFKEHVEVDIPTNEYESEEDN